MERFICTNNSLTTPLIRGLPNCWLMVFFSVVPFSSSYFAFFSLHSPVCASFLGRQKISTRTTQWHLFLLLILNGTIDPKFILIKQENGQLQRNFCLSDSLSKKTSILENRTNKNLSYKLNPPKSGH